MEGQLQKYSTQTSLKFKPVSILNMSRIKGRHKDKAATVKLQKHKQYIKIPQLKQIYLSLSEIPSQVMIFLRHYRQNPEFSKHSCIEEINSFSSNFINQENLFKTQKLMSLMFKVKRTSFQKSLNCKSLADMIYLVITQEQDCQKVFLKYKQLLQSSKGFTIKAMLLYLGIYLYMVFSRYSDVYKLLNQLLMQILINQFNQYLAVYLHIIITVKINLHEYDQALKYLKKCISISWLYNLTDLQVWCYHQMSKLYLNIQQVELSLLMKNKFESGLVEDKSSKYRAMCCQIINLEVENMKNSRSDFQIDKQDLDMTLISKRNDFESPKTDDMKHFKHVLYTMSRQRKINHLQSILPKLFKQRLKNKEEEEIKTVLYLTHLSRLKNFNMYFRNKPDKELQKNHKYITIENSSVSWAALKEICRRITIQFLL